MASDLHEMFLLNTSLLHFYHSIRWMNRLGLAAIGYTPDDKDIHPDESNASVIIIRRREQTVQICSVFQQSWRGHN